MTAKKKTLSRGTARPPVKRWAIDYGPRFEVGYITFSTYNQAKEHALDTGWLPAKVVRVRISVIPRKRKASK
jgi:hypothetical protein